MGVSRREANLNPGHFQVLSGIAGMRNLEITSHLLLILLTLFGVQLLLGKKASFPYGVIMGLSPVAIGVVVLFSEVVQGAVLMALLSTAHRIRWLSRLRQRLIVDEERLKQSRWWRRFHNMKRLSIVVVVSTPLAGGIWTGTILWHLFGLKKLDAVVLLGIGSVIGCAIFVLSFIGIVNWIS
ncbi:MAG: hypothetical protein C4524_03070 [Candidatus Zixiibacteriota bacterium]|nr:MAG: hypothetical protein C4524_03070 [candidate division Zixibacteria bacterium]